VTYSPKVFIPLTMLCQDRCGYCTFAKAPARLADPYLSHDQVIDIARAGLGGGLPRGAVHPGRAPRAALRDGAPLARRARLCLDRRLRRRHGRGGARRDWPATARQRRALYADELAKLRPVAASQGMMLETLVQDLPAHRRAPDKVPARRLATLEAAGELAIPFTTGILVGIGEDRADRLRALEAIAESHRRHGHVQEVIVQNFLPKLGTAMAAWPPCPEEELVWSIAAARLLLDPAIHLQAPPNSPTTSLRCWRGIDDWAACRRSPRTT